jgi:hypothetical protein
MPSKPGGCRRGLRQYIAKTVAAQVIRSSGSEHLIDLHRQGHRTGWKNMAVITADGV